MSQQHVFENNAAFVDGSAAFIVDLAAEAIKARGQFTIALSGGGTPRPVYARLAAADYRDRIAWDKVHIFFGDERCVPPDDALSNFRMVREQWLDPAGIPAGNVHRIRGEDDPALEALRYEQEITSFHRTAAFPAIDLVLLGMGDNGHTASLFPGTAALREKERMVVAQYVEVMNTWRVTFTAPFINAARHVAFMVEGAGKTETPWNVLKGPYQPDVWPSQLIEPTGGEMHRLLAAAAASRLVVG